MPRKNADDEYYKQHGHGGHAHKRQAQFDSLIDRLEAKAKKAEAKGKADPTGWENGLSWDKLEKKTKKKDGPSSGKVKKKAITKAKPQAPAQPLTERKQFKLNPEGAVVSFAKGKSTKLPKNSTFKSKNYVSNPSGFYTDRNGVVHPVQ